MRDFVQKHSKILSIIFIVCILFNISSAIYSNLHSYTSFTYWQRFPEMKTQYVTSQYVDKHPKQWISDALLYSYAGGEYLRGISPVLINPDAPPLGKYLIGLSIFLFNNENIIIIFFGILSVIAMYLVGKQIFSLTPVALLTPFLYSFEPLFKNQFTVVPVFDIMQLPYLLFSFYFFNKGIQTKKYWLFFLFASIFLGLFISTKFFATGITIVIAMYVVLFFHKQWHAFIPYTATLPVGILLLLATYIRVFSFKSYTLFSFLGIQKYVLLYHKSQLILPFSIWPLILFNRWYVWFGNIPVLSDPLWTFMWPTVTVLSIIVLCLYLLQKIERRKEITLLLAWAASYFLFFSFGEIFSRYLFILLPVLYMISIYGIKEISRKLSTEKRR